jgi:N-methylhydantoinase B
MEDNERTYRGKVALDLGKTSVLMTGNVPHAVTLEVYRHQFSALTEEMGAALRRASFSPNIKERRDYSCALFSPAGLAVAMGDHMPVHLGAMPMSVQAALAELGDLAPGDVACLNDPFRGGTHLPDITLIAPIHDGGSPEASLLGFVASRAHHSDVGGMTPGSMPLAREIFQEGLRIPPVRLLEGGRRNEDLWRLMLANVRTPEERAGDLDAQLAALYTGRTRLLEMVARKGSEEVLAAMEGLVAYADRLLGRGIARIPDGEYEGHDQMDDDGFESGPIPIRVRLTVQGQHLTVDFNGTSAQVPGGVNAVAAITASATRYVVRCVVQELLGEALPAGGGSMQNVTLDLPELLPALSQGTMNNTTVGGLDPRTGEAFAYYETVGGGMGAGPAGPGLSAVHTHMSNSLNTPVEALEHAYPFRVTHYSVRRGSGGEGRHRGGDGLRRDVMLLTDGQVTLLSERRLHPPAGALGGGPGARGQNVLIREGREETLPGKVTFQARAGDVISVRSPGGGGWQAGSPGSGSV